LNLSATEIRAQAAWTNAPFAFGSNSLNPWVWEVGKMPRLFNETIGVSWPAWLIDPASITIAFNPAALVPLPELDNVIISDVVQIHHSGLNGPTSAEITVTGSYTSIEWYYNNMLLSSTNTVTLSAADSRYNMIDAINGEKFLTLEVTSGGIPYSRTILFRVRP